ncbi:MAG: pyrimidine-nucleoside phosphorylase [Bacillota bacterium]|nr:pyrimidine-nucleoside phosphorylase [Bacillota bacterium]
MNVVDIITKKKNREELTREELEYMVKGFNDGSIPDYQMSAFLMAVVLQGMSRENTVALTEIMRDSGDVMDLSGINGIKVDKHSTGGVGDKTTLIVAPIAAAAGVPIAKMSGRGLGFTGGTVDKMESIPGFRTSMEKEEFIRAVNERGIAVIGQTGNLAPADKKIYALRDVTGTTESLALITSSIMSKKLAAGSDAIVLDVKCGSGAFMKTLPDAEELAHSMVDIGKAAGKNTIAIISDMNQPLGNAVGNALEVQEAMDVLKGKGPEDIRELSLNLAGAMVVAGGIIDGKAFGSEDSVIKGVKLAEEMLDSGKALEKFREFVEGQGGNPEIINDYSLMAQPAYSLEVRAEESGYVSKVDALKIGLASQHTGAGRERKEDSIDMSAGIVLNKKIGDELEKGDLLFTAYANDKDKLARGAEEAKAAYEFGKTKEARPSLIKKVIE